MKRVLRWIAVIPWLLFGMAVDHYLSGYLDDGPIRWLFTILIVFVIVIIGVMIYVLALALVYKIKPSWAERMFIFKDETSQN
jgi:hypothetical protein